MVKQIDYDKMTLNQLRNIYLDRCEQQGVSAGAHIPKTKSRLIQTIMEKDILLEIGKLADSEENYRGKQPVLIIDGGKD